MTSLVIYILSFVVIIGIVGSITVFFNNNLEEVNMTSGASSEYNKFNLYMLSHTKNGYSVAKYATATDTNQYVTFSNGTEKNTFVLLGNILYFNETKLCENIDEFKVEQMTAENGKSVLKTYLNINGTVYTTDYVIE